MEEVWLIMYVLFLICCAFRGCMCRNSEIHQFSFSHVNNPYVVPQKQDRISRTESQFHQKQKKKVSEAKKLKLKCWWKQFSCYLHSLVSKQKDKEKFMNLNCTEETCVSCDFSGSLPQKSKYYNLYDADAVAYARQQILFFLVCLQIFPNPKWKRMCIQCFPMYCNAPEFQQHSSEKSLRSRECLHPSSVCWGLHKQR